MLEQVPIQLILDRCVSFWFENLLKTKKTTISQRLNTHLVNTTLKNNPDLVYIRVTLYFTLSE